MLALLLLGSLSLIGNRTAHAQGAASDESRWPQPHRGADPVFGVRLGPEVGSALALGLRINGTWGMESWGGPIIALEPGLRSVRVSAGLAFMSPFVANAMQFRATALHAWSGDGTISVGQTYVGPEFRLTLAFVSVGVGRYWRTRGRAPGEAAFYGLTYGFGF
jgi:hypothetical protein